MPRVEKIKDIKQGDFLTFKASDDEYRVIFCIDVCKRSSPIMFTFAASTYKSKDKPTYEALLNSSFYGRGDREDFFKSYTDEDSRQIWNVHPEIKPYVLGAYHINVLRKEFMKVRDKFEFLINLNILENLYQYGNGGIYCGTMEYLRACLNFD